MKIRSILLVLSLAAFASGCFAQAASPVTGVFYSDVKAPLDAEGDAQAVREGQACTTSILGMVATGDASIEAAKEEGGITDVATVDYSSSGVLGIFAEFCTIVHGE